MRKKTTGRICVPKSISFDPELIAKIQDRADELRMSFSEYISHIARIEVSKRGEPFVVLPIKAVSRKSD
jgi:hypothetical protein